MDKFLKVVDYKGLVKWINLSHIILVSEAKSDEDDSESVSSYITTSDGYDVYTKEQAKNIMEKIQNVRMLLDDEEF